MRIAIMGSGGLGGYYGGVLARAGEDVTFIARGAHLDAIRSQGLKIKSPDGGEFTIKAEATDDPGKLDPVDLVMFCVKTYDTDAAAEQIRPIVGPDTVVTSIQNGIDSAERIGQVIAPGHIIGGVSYVSSVIEKPGVVDFRFAGMTSFGELDGSMTPRLEQLVKTFEKAGVNVEARSDIRTYSWEKFAAFCGFASVEVLTRLPAGPVLAFSDTKALARGALKEVQKVAQAVEVTLPENFPDKMLDFAASAPATHRPSMYYDLVGGKRLELESLNGTVVRLGTEHGVETPLNFAIYAALKPYVDGAPELPS